MSNSKQSTTVHIGNIDIQEIFSCPKDSIIAIVFYGDDQKIRECKEFPLPASCEALKIAQSHCTAFWKTSHTAFFFKNDLQWETLGRLGQQVIYGIRNNGDIHFRYFGKAIPLVKEGAAELDAYLEEKCM